MWISISTLIVKNKTIKLIGVPIVAWRKQTWLGSMRMWVRSLTSLSGLKIQRCRELWCTLQMWCGSDLALLWPWCRPAAVALIRPLAWELPQAAGAALKSKTKPKKQHKIDKQQNLLHGAGNYVQYLIINLYIHVYMHVYILYVIYTYLNQFAVHLKTQYLKPTILQ